MSPLATNGFLDRLSPELRQSLLTRLEPVALPLRTGIYSPGASPKHIHFITSGFASVVTTMLNGDSIEVGLVGREGVPEVLHLIGPTPAIAECFIQLAGTALRMDFKAFEQEFFPLDPVRRLVLEQVQYTALTMGQIAACNRLHEVEERLARWLLMVADRIGQDHFYLTQEFLSEMIGSRRSTVTITAGTLKRANLIDYNRGQIRILDRPALEDVACECYPITQRLLHSLDGEEAARTVLA